ncbi:unnamed protein product, partial [Mesorhabditis spiculigera]
MSDDSGNLQNTRRANAEDAAKRAETLIELLRYVSGWTNVPPNSLLEAQASPGHERRIPGYPISPICFFDSGQQTPTLASSPSTSVNPASPELISAEKLDGIIGKLLSSTTLSQSEARQFINVLTSPASPLRYKLQRLTELTPSHYKLLIELNPKVASDVLSYLLRSDPDRINTIIGVLMSMEFSVQCADVIRKIYKTAPSLPTAPLVTYIQHLFQICQDSSKPSMQIRHVRVTAMLVATLLNEGTIKSDDLYTEINAFCLQFSSNQATSTLFQQLKAQQSQE